MNFDPYNQYFDYAFTNDTSNITNANGRKVEVLNWIDLPIYHEKFTRKYENHVPIDTPAYYCQVIHIIQAHIINGQGQLSQSLLLNRSLLYKFIALYN